MTHTLGRMALIYDLGPDGAQPIGVALEYPTEVRIAIPPEHGFPSYYRDPFRVGGTRTIGIVTYHPGDPEYWVHVLTDVQRSFAVVPVAVPQ